MNTSETICAIATAPGGAIGLIRVSGIEAIGIVDRIFKPVGKDRSPLVKREAYTLTFGHIYDEADICIDEVLVSLFRAPHSYTGEDSIEISCHGSSYILQRIIRLLISTGCRSAAPGEFTQRAFLNGKMDLSQAEAVADLIASTNEATHKLALHQMRGGFSRALRDLRERLLKLTALMELELDFADHEELEFADRTELQTLSAEISSVISRLVDSFATGNALKNGIPVAIIGQTNAGKSTLLNALLNDDKAIVSDIHGTTRDIIEDTVQLNGITFRFIDTAGIRETSDTIEALGIERSFRALDQAKIVIWVYDSHRHETDFADFYKQVSPHLKQKKVILVINKCDTAELANQMPLPPVSLPEHFQIIPMSAKTGYNLLGLKDMLINLSSLPSVGASNIIVTNIRHYEALSRALEAITRVEEGLQTHLSGDLIAQDLRECIYYLSDIAGEVTTDQVLHHIFKHFCIGK